MNRLRSLGLLSFAAVALAPVSHAGLLDFSLFRNVVFSQTGPSTTAPDGAQNYFFSGNALVNAVSDFDMNGLTLADPNGATHTLTGPQVSGSFIQYIFSSSFLSKSDLDSMFPAGTYTLDAMNTGSMLDVMVSQLYDGTDFYAPAPTLTPATFNGLAGLNPNQDFTFLWNPFVLGAMSPVNTPLIFFNIRNQSNSIVFSQAFSGASATSVVVPKGTLQPNTAYSSELDFSSRIDQTSANNITCSENAGPAGPDCPGRTELAWDSRTETNFTTGNGVAGVPEPSSLSLIGLGFAALSLLRRLTA